MPKPLNAREKVRALREVLDLVRNYLTGKTADGTPMRVAHPPDYLLRKIQHVKQATGQAVKKARRVYAPPMFDGVDDKPESGPPPRAKHS